MKISRKTICEDTLELLRQFYCLNSEPLFSVLAEDCVWLGSENTLVIGAEAIKDFLKTGFVCPVFSLEDTDFRQIRTGCEDQLMVMGQYTCYSDKDAEVICSARQRVTFCYRRKGRQWKLYHVHVSNEWNQVTGDAVLPAKISSQTYRYVKKLLAENRTRKSPVLIIKNDQVSQFVNTGLLLYIQAMDRDCILHMLNERRQVSRPLKELEEQLPSNFYRIHRSFFVNVDYVEKIERYTVTLVTGEQLPIPKMRYMQVREELTSLIETMV